MGIPKTETKRFLKVIRKLGYTSAAKLATKMGISRQRLSQAIHNPKRARFIRRRIAEALGLSYEETWGMPEPIPEPWANIRTITYGIRGDTRRFLRFAHKAGYPTVKAVAEAAGISAQKLLALIYGKTENAELRKKIAALLGVKYEELWYKAGSKIAGD